MRTFDDILPQVSGAKFFTKFDARSGYWVLKLDDESSFLWTFNTPFGRYRVRRLPFALKSSQDEFSKKIEDLSGVVIILDSILVFGSFRAEQYQCLRAVLARARNKGIRFNEKVMVTELSYFGHVIPSQGLMPDPFKVKAVGEMKPSRPKQSSGWSIILQSSCRCENCCIKMGNFLGNSTLLYFHLLSGNTNHYNNHKRKTSFYIMKIYTNGKTTK